MASTYIVSLFVNNTCRSGSTNEFTATTTTTENNNEETGDIAAERMQNTESKKNIQCNPRKPMSLYSFESQPDQVIHGNSIVCPRSFILNTTAS